MANSEPKPVAPGAGKTGAIPRIAVTPPPDFCGDPEDGFSFRSDFLSGDHLSPRFSEKDGLAFVATGLSSGGLAVAVEAAWWDDSGERAAVYRAAFAYEAIETAPLSIEVPLLPAALNHIAFMTEGADGLSQAIASYHVYLASHIIGLPRFFALWKDTEVTQAELDAELKRILELVRKVSAELAPCTDGPIIFTDDESPATGKIDDDGPNTLDNIRTRLSRPKWRALLLSIKCAQDEDEAARRRADATVQLLAQLLHETTHRKRIKADLHDNNNLGKEEDETTAELLGRLISLLEKLERRLAPPADPPEMLSPLDDGEGLEGEDLEDWFRRLRAIVDNQIKYRFKTVPGRRRPWLKPHEKVERKGRLLQDKLKDIRGRNRLSSAEKQERARKAFEKFLDQTKEQREMLEKDFDVDWVFELDEEALILRAMVKCRGTYQGRPIPEL